MKKLKVAVVIGHRPGAPGAYGNTGISEYEFNTLVAKDIKKAFKDNPNVSIKIFERAHGRGGYTRKMKALHKKIDAWGANLSLSLHFNAASNPKAVGHEVLYCSKTGGKFADQLNYSFSLHIGGKNRGIKRKRRGERGAGFLCNGKSYAILAEPFFAAHQDRFSPGTKGYKMLVGSYTSFIFTAAAYWEEIKNA